MNKKFYCESGKNRKVFMALNHDDAAKIFIHMIFRKGMGIYIGVSEAGFVTDFEKDDPVFFDIHIYRSSALLYELGCKFQEEFKEEHAVDCFDYATEMEYREREKTILTKQINLLTVHPGASIKELAAIP